MTRTLFKNVLEDILCVPRGGLRETDSRDSVAGWSSIADVQIITFVSSQFGLEPDMELLEAETVGDLLDVLEQRRAITA